MDSVKAINLKKNAQEAKNQSHQNFYNVEQFQTALNQAPKDKFIQSRNGIKYLPISYIQDKLDELYFGLWEEGEFSWGIVGNELLGSMELKVFHPIAQQWMTRIGVAGVQITMQKGAKPTDIDKKYINAVETCGPHLKADCLKNAAKSLGKLFGRDLARKIVNDYTPLIGDVVGKHDQKIIKEIEGLSNQEAAIEWKQNNQHIFEDPQLALEFNKKFKTWAK